MKKFTLCLCALLSMQLISCFAGGSDNDLSKKTYALFKAIDTGDMSALKKAIRPGFAKKGANVNAQWPGSKHTPLHRAVNKERFEILQYLLGDIKGGFWEKNRILADPNIQNKDGQTPLFFAYQLGYGENQFVKLLLKMGARKNIIDTSGHTADYYNTDSNNQ